MNQPAVNTPSTKLGRGAFPGKPRRAHTAVNLDAVQKCRDPYKPERVIQERKYDELFKNVAEGDCFRVPGGANELSSFARAVRLHFQRKGMQAIVRQQSRTDDGIGRVWVLKILQQPAASKS